MERLYNTQGRPSTRLCPWITEVASAAEDSDLIGIGSSPGGTGRGRTGVRVPAEATPSQDSRYLIRLCGVPIPSGGELLVRGLRQLATIRGQVTVGEDEDAVTTVFEREIESPLWSFQDGNITWGLRWLNESEVQQQCGVGALAGLGSALTYLGDDTVPYRVPAGGKFPGTAVGALGAFYDIRYPWTSTDWSMSEYFYGPGAVILFASVYQTNTVGRTSASYPALEGMRVEDLFVSSLVSSAIYGRVAGSIIYEMMPCCREEKEKGDHARVD